jgi:predicted esterase YcpF (UPF0227 family)
MTKIGVLTSILALLLAFFSSSAFADKITPINSCTKPHHPYKFKSESEVSDYKAQVESYKKCMNDFIEEQNQAIEKHRAAINQAITEWNFFVNTDLR